MASSRGLISPSATKRMAEEVHHPEGNPPPPSYEHVAGPPASSPWQEKQLHEETQLEIPCPQSQPLTIAHTPAPGISKSSKQYIQVQVVEPEKQVIIQRRGKPLVDPPQDYIGASIMACICCCWLLGIVPIVYSIKSQEAAARGDREKAKRSSEAAQKWIIVTVICGVILDIISIIFRMQANSL